MAVVAAGPILHPPGDSLAHRARRRILAILSRNSLYPLSLAGGAPRELARRAAIAWPADAQNGEAIVKGEFHLCGETLRLAPPFAAPREARAEWLAEFHGFPWLADLVALGTPEALHAAREAIATWLAECGAWHPLAWRSDILAARILSWMAHFDAIFGGSVGAGRLQRSVLASLARQYRHLTRVAAYELVGGARLRGLKGLVIGGLCLDPGERRIAPALAALDRELPAQILPDGGHVERSPAVQLAVLRDLVELRAGLRAAHVVVPDSIQMAIDRMAPMLRLFRHGDGLLAQFNDTPAGAGAEAELVLTRSEVRGKPLHSAPHSGFQRLQAGKTLVIQDTGPPPPHGLDHHAHAGVFSFEMSHGRERLIVNCGAYRGPGGEWRRVARNTAAHSALIVSDTNSAEIQPDGTLGRRPAVSPVDRVEDEGSQWISASHSGYGPNFALTHGRQLFLSADGDDLRGEDTLTGRAGEGFAIRFHLHPTVQISLMQEGGAALLRLPSGIGFRLRAQGAQMNIGESVYLGEGEIRKTQQIVLSGHVGTQGATVRWAIRREAKKAAES